MKVDSSEFADFSVTVEAARRRIEALLARHPANSPDRLREEFEMASAELMTTVEELSVAEEELRVQNDEIAGTHEELERQRRRYHELFNLAPDAFVVTDTVGVIREANQAAAQLFKMDAGRLVGKPLVLYVADPVAVSFRARLEALAAGKSMSGWDLELKPRRQTPVQVSASTRPVVDRSGQVAGILWSLRDVSEVAKLASRLETLNSELERRVEQRTAELRAASRFNEELLEQERSARSEAERANRIKSDFFAVMSHEFRTPLQAIFGYTELLERQLDGPLSPGQAAHIERIKQNQDHLLGLVNRILDFARLDAVGPAELSLELRPACEMLTVLKGMIQPLVEQKGLTLHLHESPKEITAYADWERVQQILLNLVSNAVKFTSRGGEVRIACRQAGDEVEFNVADTGDGVPAEMHEHIFEPFVQVRGASRTTQGTGLGLAISRNLARAMGGDLRVTSEPGRGSTFTLSLPRSPA